MKLCTLIFVICSCNHMELITEEIQTSEFKAKKSNEPVEQVLIFALNLRVNCTKLIRDYLL